MKAIGWLLAWFIAGYSTHDWIAAKVAGLRGLTRVVQHRGPRIVKPKPPEVV
jgi:hypothetical protein